MRKAILALVLLAGGTFAQDWNPSRPIRWIIPWPPGGATDAMARITAQKLAEKLGVTITPENRAGGNGTVGSEVVRSAAPDGTTFLFSASIHVMLNRVLRAAPFDPVADFTPVARVGQGPLLVMVNNDVPGATITDVVAAIRAAPERFTFSTSSLGAAGHLALVEFNRLAGVDVVIAPYRGTAPSLTDLMGGRIQLTIDAILAGLPHVRGGRVRALAITASTRSAAAPEIPTAAEAGMPGLEFFSWYAVWGPRGLPPAIVGRVNAALQAGMREPDVVGRLTALGFEPVAESAADFASYIVADVARNAELLRRANFQPE
jgi:tripartite-type tricarboxylate transporter receptor subunit TctC